MYGSSDKKKRVKIEELIFYFDAEERTRLDVGGIGRKAGELLALREKLVRLPDEEFDAIIAMMRRLVEERSALVQAKEAERTDRSGATEHLAKETAARGVRSPKISAI